MIRWIRNKIFHYRHGHYPWEYSPAVKAMLIEQRRLHPERMYDTKTMGVPCQD